jgi:hypothetical protein
MSRLHIPVHTLRPCGTFTTARDTTLGRTIHMTHDTTQFRTGSGDRAAPTAVPRRGGGER